MKSKFYDILFVVSILFLFGGNSISAQTSPSKSPRVFLLNPQTLRDHQAKINEAEFKSALAKLEKEAQKDLKIVFIIAANFFCSYFYLF